MAAVSQLLRHTPATSAGRAAAAEACGKHRSSHAQVRRHHDAPGLSAVISWDHGFYLHAYDSASYRPETVVATLNIAFCTSQALGAAVLLRMVYAGKFVHLDFSDRCWKGYHKF